MIAVPCPTSREYKSAFPTGIRVSRGAAFGLLSGAVVEVGENPAGYANARIATARVAFIGLKLHQAVTGRNPLMGKLFL
jgi:hypothetical protein